MSDVGFVGCGTLSAAIVRGLLTADAAPFINTIYVSPRNREKAQALATDFPGRVVVAADNQSVVDKSTYVFLAVRPQVCDGIVPLLKFRDDHKVISLMASVPFAKLEVMCNVDQSILARACPVPSVSTRRGTTLVVGEGDSGRFAKEVFDFLGGAVVVSTEKEMDLLMTVPCMMGPYYEQQRRFVLWLKRQGVDEHSAANYTARVYHMYASDVLARCDEGVRGLAELVDEQTPGGINENNIRKLEGAGFYDAQDTVLDATYDRLTGK